MAYSTTNAKEIAAPAAATIVDAVILEIKDGKVKDFISAKGKEKWKNTDQPAIELLIEGKYEGIPFRIKQMVSYLVDEATGATTYKSDSALGVFKKNYKKIPEVGMKVKCIFKGGFWKLFNE